MNLFNFFKMWKNKSIKSRVMSVVKDRINSAQEKFEAKCAEIDELCNVKIQEIEDKRVADKDKHADDLVQEILAR